MTVKSVEDCFCHPNTLVFSGGKRREKKWSNLSKIERYKENNVNIYDFSAISNIKQRVVKGISVLNFSNTWNVAEWATTLLCMALSERGILADPERSLE